MTQTAEYFRNKSDGVNALLSDVTKILNEVDRQAENGNYLAYWHEIISNNAIENLKSLGFSVSSSYNQHDGYTYTIRWDK